MIKGCTLKVTKLLLSPFLKVKFIILFPKGSFSFFKKQLQLQDNLKISQYFRFLAESK